MLTGNWLTFNLQQEARLASFGDFYFCKVFPILT